MGGACGNQVGRSRLNRNAFFGASSSARSPKLTCFAVVDAKRRQTRPTAEVYSFAYAITGSVS
jgi:hypothetical protein